MTEDREASRRINRYAVAFRRRRAWEKAAWSVAGPFLRHVLPRPKITCRDDRLLVVQRILRIGDTLVARPALAALRKQFKEAEVAVVCHPNVAPLCRADDLVDFVIEARAKVAGFAQAVRECQNFGAKRAFVFVTDRWSPFLARLAGAREITGYDYAGRGFPLTVRKTPPVRANVPTFLYPADAPAVRAAEIWTALVGAKEPVSEYPAFRITDGARVAENFLRPKGIDPASRWVIVHTGAANPSYLWRAANWVTVGRSLLGYGVKRLLLTGSTVEKRTVAALARNIGEGAVNAAGELDLVTLCAVVERAAVVISLDTALIHIAATMKTPVVGLYGPGDEFMWAPLGVPHRVVTGDSPCRGCKAAWCFQKRHYCMEAITTEMVVTATMELLAETNR